MQSAEFRTFKFLLSNHSKSIELKELVTYLVTKKK